jgi:energy-coupling factor transporter ATP-binding protein EcfA2
MAEKSFTASKSRSNRPGWSVTFRHPVRTDSRGERGVKVRRGLGTSDEEEANRLVAQLNELLHDEYWWSGDRRSDAESRYEPVVVSAFFDGIEASRIDPDTRRSDVIPLPNADDGYSTVMFLGTTGAGKTTLLRHVIGSDPEADRFPSTSTAKTTTADFEIVTSPGSYEAAVTFMPEHEVRAHIDECLEEACLEAVQKKPDGKIAAALLEHREQRFRLSYVLGGWTDTAAEEADDFSFEGEQDTVVEIDEAEAVPPEEREQNHARLKEFVSRIKTLTAEVEEKFAGSLGKIADQKTADDRATWLELFGVEAFKHQQFSNLALDIMEEVADRFSKIEDGELQRSSTDWPFLWTIEIDDREHFLSAVRWFSSNHHKQFGRLLTPLVDGIRVKGPLFPELADISEDPRLVLLDGQGLGHTATSVSSVSTRITNKFAKVDMILLVDNAQQPMQAAPLALLRSVGSSGFARKLAIAFTHFDQVKGANLGSFEQKRDHVLGSVGNAIASLRDIVGSGVAGAIERQVDNHSIFLGGLDRRTAKLPGGFRRELARLIDMMQHAIEPVERTDCSPMYEFKGLEIAMHDAIDAFRDPWCAKLGLSYHDGISKEHWTRIKALSRRLANHWADEYDTLTPVADLLARLQEEASKWLDRPAGWTRQPEDDDEREIALDAIREAVFKELSRLTKNRLTDEQVAHWRDAYDFSGPGSAGKRSRMIEEIHDHAAPRISAAMSADARAFLEQLHDILRDAISEAGGQVLPLSAKQSV